MGRDKQPPPDEPKKRSGYTKPTEVKLYEMPENLAELSDEERLKLATEIWEDLTGKKAAE